MRVRHVCQVRVRELLDAWGNERAGFFALHLEDVDDVICLIRVLNETGEEKGVPISVGVNVNVSVSVNVTDGLGGIDQ